MIPSRSLPLLVLSAIVCFLPSGSFSCDVPVFRYALERWMPDTYDLVVLHDGPLAPGESELLSRLQDASVGILASGGLRVVSFNIHEEEKGLEQVRNQGIDPVHLPAMVLYAPEERRIEIPVWHGELTPENIAALVDSPARRELARRIVNGDSGVWIFVECGEKSRDDAARRRLDDTLQTLENELKIEADEQTGEGWYNPGFTGTPLEVAFSTLAVSREDAAESIFLEMLMSIEPDLRQFAEHPMAIPVFGRGRALYALVGKGINAENIEEACEFLTGPCSCEAKALNPGADLLITVDWDAMLEDVGEGPVVSVPQPMVSLSTLAEAAEVDRASDVDAPKVTGPTPSLPASPDRLAAVSSGIGPEETDASVREPAGKGSDLFRNMVLALGIILLGILVWSVRMGRQISKDVS